MPVKSLHKDGIAGRQSGAGRRLLDKRGAGRRPRDCGEDMKGRRIDWLTKHVLTGAVSGAALILGAAVAVPAWAMQPQQQEQDGSATAEILSVYDTATAGDRRIGEEPVETAAGSVRNLTTALAETYLSNPTLVAQRANLRATDELVSQAVSGWRPTLQFTGSFGSTQSRSFAPFQVAENNARPIQGAISGTQPVFDGGRIWNRTRQAKAQVESARATLVQTEQQVLLDTVTAYMDVVRDRAVVELSVNNVGVLQRQLEAANARFEFGEITRTDVSQAEARLSRAESNLIQSEAALTASSAAFERVIGLPPGDLIAPPVLPNIPDTEQQALAIALDNNPSVQSAEANRKAAERAVAVAKGALLPRLDVRATASHIEDFQSAFSGSQSSSLQVTGNVTVPLYQGGAEYSQIRESKDRLSEARLRIAETRRQIEEQVAVAWEQLRSSQATIVASRQEVRANEIAFEGVTQEAQVGARTTLDVLDAEQELLDARVTLVRAQRDAYVAGFALLSAIGQLTAQGLELPVAIYRPETHYENVDGRWFGWDFGE